MKTLTKEIQDSINPTKAFDLLVDGNNRFVENNKIDRDLNAQVSQTSAGQYPFAVILSCIDSRVPAELVFDQGIGDVFSVRVAGNIVNEDILGSIEYSCKVAGSKIVVVMGHTKCGAVTSACKHVKLGNITALLEKIQPAVAEIESGGEMSPENIEKVAILNVQKSIKQIRNESPILAEMQKNKEIDIVGAIYSVETGKVLFL